MVLNICRTVLQVLLGKKLCITKTQHICALAAPTASSMTMGLTRAGFSVRRRIISNYAGQSRNGVTKKSLKVYQKMRDIQGKKTIDISLITYCFYYIVTCLTSLYSLQTSY